MILKILTAEICGPTSLRVAFNDGTTRRVNLRPILIGPMFFPLRDPAIFARVELNPVTATVEWPNGADLAPEALRELPDENGTDANRAAGN